MSGPNIGLQAMDNVRLPRHVLETIGVCAATRHRLTVAANLQHWVVSESESESESMVPSDRYLRLWELVEHETRDPAIAVRTAGHYRLGQFGIIDYLLFTAPTLGEGLALTSRFGEIASTNCFLTAVPGECPDGETTIGLELRRGKGRARELAMQKALCGLFVKIRKATEHHLVPVRVEFRQQAPEHHAEMAELFGTNRIEFAAATDRIVIHSADLALPMPQADARLNAILTHHAESLIAPEVITWTGRVQRELSTMPLVDPIAIDTVARRLYIGRRTLQRRLADEGTTWRGELDHARREFSTAHGHQPTRPRTPVGHSEARAFHRAHQHWKSGDPR
ncbi:AraC family transcriptional regulator ligand-binding domain-containing protein [Nocardia heshunensis]